VGGARSGRNFANSGDRYAFPDLATSTACWAGEKNYGVYFEVIDYNKVLRDATKRNRIFFDNLNLVKDYG
jgi:hypothetical protein